MENGIKLKPSNEEQKHKTTLQYNKYYDIIIKIQ